MQKIVMKSLKSKKQLFTISDKPVLQASFVDEEKKNFGIIFDSGDGNRRDLVISFETRSPHVYVSDEYKGV